MKNLANARSTFLGVLVVASLALPSASHGQGSASGTGSASVEIVRPISLTEVTSMSFGTLARSTTQGSATVRVDNTISTTGGVQSLGGESRAHWTAVGEAEATVDIILPADGLVFLTRSGAPSMGVNDFDRTLSDTPAFASNGTLGFFLGATLSIGANQPAGTYAGTYPVTLAYN